MYFIYTAHTSNSWSSILHFRQRSTAAWRRCRLCGCLSCWTSILSALSNWWASACKNSRRSGSYTAWTAMCAISTTSLSIASSKKRQYPHTPASILLGTRCAQDSKLRQDWKMSPIRIIGRHRRTRPSMGSTWTACLEHYYFEHSTLNQPLFRFIWTPSDVIMSPRQINSPPPLILSLISISTDYS